MTYSKFTGSLITTPAGNVGTLIWNVSRPNIRSHLTNQENSLWRAWRKSSPLPANGRVFGGFLFINELDKSKEWKGTENDRGNKDTQPPNVQQMIRAEHPGAYLRGWPSRRILAFLPNKLTSKITIEKPTPRTLIVNMVVHNVLKLKEDGGRYRNCLDAVSRRSASRFNAEPQRWCRVVCPSKTIPIKLPSSFTKLQKGQSMVLICPRIHFYEINDQPWWVSTIQSHTY